jgi:hypothetical protein
MPEALSEEATEELLWWASSIGLDGNAEVRAAEIAFERASDAASPVANFSTFALEQLKDRVADRARRRNAAPFAELIRKLVPTRGAARSAGSRRVPGCARATRCFGSTDGMSWRSVRLPARRATRPAGTECGSFSALGRDMNSKFWRCACEPSPFSPGRSRSS